MTEAEELWCEVSDDEMYNPGKEKKGTWEPKAEDILRIFDELKSKKVLDLHWKCPGRRPPDSEDDLVEESAKEELLTTPVKLEEKKPAVPNEFDFDGDEPSGSKTVITPRRTPGSAPKSQKREARMDKILKDIMQQRKIQAAEREARKLAGARSPRAPSSPGRARIGSPAGSPRTPNRQSPVRVGAGLNDSISNTPARGPIDMPMPARVARSELSSNNLNSNSEGHGQVANQNSQPHNSSINNQAQSHPVSGAVTSSSPAVTESVQITSAASNQGVALTPNPPNNDSKKTVDTNNFSAEKMDTS